jgi:serine/threonine-protein kinase
LAYYEMKPDSHRDIWLLPLEGKKTPEPFLVTPFNERSPSFSPDGRFLAYVSDESGQDEVYVQRVDRSGGKLPVSTGGGREPVWSRDGRELFYWRENRLMAVDVETGSAFKAGAPQLLFEAPYIRQPTPGSGSQNYDVSPDGQRFLMVLPGEAAMELHVVLNWFDELNRLVPSDH